MQSKTKTMIAEANVSTRQSNRNYLASASDFSKAHIADTLQPLVHDSVSQPKDDQIRIRGKINPAYFAIKQKHLNFQ